MFNNSDADKLGSERRQVMDRSSAISSNETGHPDPIRENGPGDSAQADRDAFATLLMGYCRKRDQRLDLVYDRKSFKIADKATGTQMALSNVYADYCAAEDDHRQDVLAQYTAFFSNIPELPSSFSEAEGRLFPVICNRWANDIRRLDNAEAGRPPAECRRLTDNLAVAVVYDTSTAAVDVSPDTLKRWGVNQEAAFATAIGNMQKLMTGRILNGQIASPAELAAQHGLTTSQVLGLMHQIPSQTVPPTQPHELEPNFVSKMSLEDLGFGLIEGYPGLFVASGDDWFCSSRILIESWIRLLPVKGEPVAMVICRGTLLVTGTEDSKSLQKMAELAERLHGHSHSASFIPIRLTSNGWNMYQPPRNHHAYNAFHSLRSREMQTLYSYQEGILQKLPISEHRFVSPCFLGSQKDACVDTISTWSRDVDTLLPKTDWVAFVSVVAANTMAAIVPPVPWDAAQSIVGHRMELTEFSPPRYRTMGFPCEQEMARLEKAADRGRWKLRSKDKSL